MRGHWRWIIALASLVLAAGSVRAESWTGFYGGANAGYGWGDNSVRFAGDSPNNDGAGNLLLNLAFASMLSFKTVEDSQGLDAKGFVGGGEFGYNWRLTKDWVAGLETDLQYSGVDGERATSGNGPFPFGAIGATVNSEQDLKWFGTVRGRLGFLATEQILLFGTAGLAYGRTEASASITTTGLFIGGAPTQLGCPINQVCIAGSDSKTSTGWTVGGGFEWAVWKYITVKAEYLHVDLGDQTVTLVAQPPANGNGFVTAKFDNSFEVVRAGLNFRLN
jgi:outer membrane immunogenic protein